MSEMLTNDFTAFSSYYAKNYDQVLHYILKRIGNLHDAEDLAAESFLYCFSHYDQFDASRSSLNTWVYLVVNSRIKNYYRDKKDTMSIDSLAVGILDESVDMDACIHLEQTIARVMNALDSLPERQRKIIFLRYFYGKSNSEIADLLGISNINVRVLLSRALDKLEKKCLKYVKEDV